MFSPSESLRDQTKAFVEQNRFDGAVLVGKGKTILYCEAFGLADRAASRAVTTDTIFEAGSMSKWIAAIVTLRLVDQGKLTLYAPVSAYLPGFRKDVGDRITLDHLLSHTSGVPNDIIPALRANPNLALAGLTQAEAVEEYASGSLRFAPGSDWEYSHSNWILVKAIVERASGTSYEQFARETLWQPLGLKRSGIYSGLAPDASDVALSYSSNGPESKPVVQRLPEFLQMAGGFYCSAADLLNVMEAVTNGALLSTRAKEELFRVRWTNEHYALGCRVDVHRFAGKDRRFIAEDGANAGFRSVAYRTLPGGETCILLNNTTMPLGKTGPFALQLLDTIVG
ncbi:MAG: serine hydrolase domain-containing protein [Gemmatimonadaceae bacterium]